MTTAQPKDTPSTDSRESLVLGIYDRLYDHGHCAVDVVLAPAKDDGAPDWERADPATVEALPHDIFPADAADRACVIVSNVDGCDPDATFLVRFVDDRPDLIQIHGPEIDRPIAEQIIARDIGAEPPPPPQKSRLQESLDRLSEKFEREAEQRHQAANDNNPPNGKARWVAIDPADYADKPVPPRQWYIDGLVPARNVTLLSGDGGTGKSLLALQVAAAGALGIGTLDLRPAAGRTLVLAAEDEWDEVHRRLADICTANHADLSDLRGMMRVLPLAGHDAELARPDPKTKTMRPTDQMQKLVDQIVEFRPALVVLDTSADLFGGDEINRNQVRWFVSTLRGLAMELDCAVLLLSHPSVQGMQTGTGLSGSTAWNNSVRSRLYLTGDKDDDDLRVLTGKKANYTWERELGEWNNRLKQIADEETRILKILDSRKPAALAPIPEGEAIDTSGSRTSGRNAAAEAALREAEAVKVLIADLQFEREQIGLTDLEKRTNETLRRAGAAATAEEREQIKALVAEIERETESLKANEAAQQARTQAIEGLFQMGGDALTAMVDGSMKAEDALKRLIVQLAAAAAQAALLGSGPLAGLFGGGCFGGPATITNFSGGAR